MALSSARSSGIYEPVCFSELAGASLFLSAAAAPPAGVSGGGAADDEPAGGVLGGCGDVAGGLSPGAVWLSAGFGPKTGDAGESTLPRMIGRPSLLLPMITIFVLGDCASASVASMPRQRR